MMAKRPRPRLKPPDAEARDYKVGYGKPPKASQFKAGQSGNPRGRPKGARNKQTDPSAERLKNIILEEAYRKIKINEGERRLTLTLANAVMRSVAVNAAKGQIRAQQLFATLVSETERANKAQQDLYLETAIQYKTEWEDELARRKRQGLIGPMPLPHPDDVVIDVRRGEVIMTGPITPEEKVYFDKALNTLKQYERNLKKLNEQLKEAKTKADRAAIQEKINIEERVCQFIRQRIGNWRGHD